MPPKKYEASSAKGIILKRQIKAKAALIKLRHQEVLNEEEVEEMTIYGLKYRHSFLIKNFQEFEELSDCLIRGLSTAANIEKAQNATEPIRRIYLAAIEIIEKALSIKEMAPIADSTRIESDSLSLPHMSTIRLPAAGTQSNITTDGNNIIRLETARPPEPIEFDGNPANWLAFHDRFVAEVHNNDQLDGVMKLIYLQKMCIADAKNILGEWQPIAINYAKAWESLVEKFNDVHTIREALINRLLNMSAAKEESRVTLRKMIDTTTNTLRQLSALKVDVTTWDPIVIAILMQRMPRRTADAWEQRRNIRETPSLSALLDFLEGRARGKTYWDPAQRQEHEERIQKRSRDISNVGTHRNKSDRHHGQHYDRRHERQQDNRSHRGHQNDQNRRSSKQYRNNDTTKPSCLCCKKDHFVYRCPDFRAQPIAEREKLVSKWKCCRICFRLHDGTCSWRNCNVCSQAHNGLLCDKRSNDGFSNGKDHSRANYRSNNEKIGAKSD